MAGSANRRLVLVGLALAAAQGGPAWSQSAGSSGELEEITVTATRKAESIQNVPVSVSAFDQTAITRAAISSIDDIARLTPGLDSQIGNTGQSIISIRGIYSGVGTATTGIYIDDTPIQVRNLGAGAAAASAYPTLFDLERIEVLRGPQGTLFGSGSEGGTVRFITPEPSLTEWSGHARSEYSFGDNGVPSSQFGLAGGGPIIDGRLGFRASAYVQNDAGWIDSQPYPGTTIAARNTNSSSIQAFSAALGWAATDKLTLTPALTYQRQQQDNQGTYWTNLSDAGAGRFVTGQLVLQPTSDRFVLPSLKAKWDLGGAILYSNTSYLDHKRDATDDYSLYATELLTGNYVGTPISAPAYFSNPQRQFTQEIRVQSSDPDARLHWLVGGFYQRVDQKADEAVVAPRLGDLTEALFGATVPEVFGSDVLPGGLVYYGHDTSRDTQLAAFGQVDFKITDALTVTAGLRFAHSKFEYSNFQDGPFNTGPSGSSGGDSENDNTPKVGLDYKPNDNLMFYVSAAKGFRPGGANTPVSPVLCGPDLQQLGLTEAPASYKSDHVWSYEAGSKGNALNHRVEWDASVFYVKWSDIESEVDLPSCGFDYISNLGTAVSKGFDLQFSAILVRGLMIGTAVGYTDAKYSQTIAGAGTSPVVTQGDRLLSAPWHGMVSVDYSFLPFANGANAYVHIDDEYASGYQFGNPADALFDPVTAQVKSTAFATARAGVKFNGWDVSLFAKNLFDSRSVLSTTHSVATSELITQQTFAPRTVGVTATYAF